MDRSQQVGLAMVMGVRNFLLEIEGWGWSGDHAGDGQHHIKADGDIHDLLGGDVGVGG